VNVLVIDDMRRLTPFKRRTRNDQRAVFTPPGAHAGATALPSGPALRL